MKPANLALVPVTLLGIFAAACSVESNDPPALDGTLGRSESQLVEDDAEAAEMDEDLEVGLDEPLSGAAPEDPGSPAEGATDAEVMEKVRTNPGRFFQPAGCITTTIEGNVATRVFTNCTGPYEMATFNGTVKSTYAREAGKLTVTHEATDFQINGATVGGKRVVVYERSGTTVTKTRTGSWSGTTAKGNAISHEASFVTTYDAASRCLTRDGSATTSIGGRSLTRSIDDYRRCGIGRLGCPESGTVVVTGTRDGQSLSVTVEFLGGRSYRVTGPNGRQATRQLLCRPAS